MLASLFCETRRGTGSKRHNTKWRNEIPSNNGKAVNMMADGKMNDNCKHAAREIRASLFKVGM